MYVNHPKPVLPTLKLPEFTLQFTYGYQRLAGISSYPLNPKRKFLRRNDPFFFKITALRLFLLAPIMRVTGALLGVL